MWEQEGIKDRDVTQTEWWVVNSMCVFRLRSQRSDWCQTTPLKKSILLTSIETFIFATHSRKLSSWIYCTEAMPHPFLECKLVMSSYSYTWRLWWHISSKRPQRNSLKKLQLILLTTQNDQCLVLVTDGFLHIPLCRDLCQPRAKGAHLLFQVSRH